jgi:hypothetical protein
MASGSASESNPTPPQSRTSWKATLVLLVIVGGLAVANVLVWQREDQDDDVRVNQTEAPDIPSFQGSSTKLKNTVIVPALETTFPKSKSAIWCATLPLAWQDLEKNAVKEAIVLKDAEELSRALSRSPDPGLEEKNYYSAGGFLKDGILERIQMELPKKFPTAQVPNIPPPFPRAAVAYAHLDVSLEYPFQFNYSQKPLRFTDSKGIATEVHAYGIREDDKWLGQNSYRGQVEVLFLTEHYIGVDLSKTTNPYQIILARIPRKSTLKECLEEFDNKRKGSHPTSLGGNVVLLVPSMLWEIQHHFEELEGKFFTNQGFEEYFIQYTFQQIRFKMDRKGAKVIAGTIILGGDWNGHEEEKPRVIPPDYYLFDGPFLIMMKKRDHAHPFFVMWVDNAELLQKW